MWALEFGFFGLANKLISLNVTLSSENTTLMNIVLRNTIQSGRIEESLFLIRQGASIDDTELDSLKTQISDEKYNYKCLFRMGSIHQHTDPNKFDLNIDYMMFP